jgi:hypothetical protein
MNSAKHRCLQAPPSGKYQETIVTAAAVINLSFVLIRDLKIIPFLSKLRNNDTDPYHDFSASFIMNDHRIWRRFTGFRNIR